MRVLNFDIDKGVFRFELEEISTDFHAHPAIEIVLASHGSFTLNTPEKAYPNLNFAVIRANQKHSIEAVDCQIKLVMLEHREVGIKADLASYGILFNQKLYVEKAGNSDVELNGSILDALAEREVSNDYEDRINTCIAVFKNESLEYSSMIQKLKSLVYLSESRLSHIFKAQVGISLKRYLVWSRLKRTIHTVLNRNENLFSAALTCGFYDQAHLTKAFKEMLGITPSAVYNSRTLQD